MGHPGVIHMDSNSFLIIVFSGGPRHVMRTKFPLFPPRAEYHVGKRKVFKLIELDGTKQGPHVIGECEDVLRGSIKEIQRRLAGGEITESPLEVELYAARHFKVLRCHDVP